MTTDQGGSQRGTDVLIRHVERRLAALRATAPERDAPLAERLADTLRALVVATSGASAADRARVRAAVRFFALRRDGRLDRLPGKALAAELRVVNRTARDLGRDDLVIHAADVAETSAATDLSGDKPGIRT